MSPDDDPICPKCGEKNRRPRRRDRVKEEERFGHKMELFGLELRVDEWREIHHCKRVSNKTFKEVLKVVGEPADHTWEAESAFLDRFFIELRNQRPDLFQHGSKRRRSQSQGCLVLVVIFLLITCAVIRMRASH